MVEKIKNVRICDDSYPGKDLYCDGLIEDEILEIVKKYDESEYSRIVAEKKEWPVYYHLSNLRKNILEWYPITKEDTVLEIGSGCGAITGLLANKAKSVTCIDLSKKRSLINAHRNGQYDNIDILLGNFEDVEKTLTEKYNVITLIGVFEYAESYISGENPGVEFLKIIKKHLAVGGKILLAIENKLGMKYWAGCQEDHYGQYFVGLENYSNLSGIRTYSKKELQRIIEQAGMNEMKFYYPYPDYKFMTTLYSDDYLPQKGDLNNNIRNFDRPRYVLFDEAKVFDSVIEENEFPLFSNSFFVEITKKEENGWIL